MQSARLVAAVAELGSLGRFTREVNSNTNKRKALRVLEWVIFENGSEFQALLTGFF